MTGWLISLATQKSKIGWKYNSRILEKAISRTATN
jgi:hypothetical protein